MSNTHLSHTMPLSSQLNNSIVPYSSLFCFVPRFQPGQINVENGEPLRPEPNVATKGVKAEELAKGGMKLELSPCLRNCRKIFWRDCVWCCQFDGLCWDIQEDCRAAENQCKSPSLGVFPQYAAPFFPRCLIHPFSSTPHHHLRTPQTPLWVPESLSAILRRVSLSLVVIVWVVVKRHRCGEARACLSE
ncbi:hypothetical protein Nepgr_025940 [Nepenthes gracilis]|uniref:Uncharacterized protein n=1 Tax=Nepenthes gracilis TaxID=150966 RepID=A0AAD3T7E3_NEPGR|nr:hypothetical protein Nepgr_025940 [Nepenthes gracilis]